MVPNREVSAWTPLSRALFNASRCVFNSRPPATKLLQFPRFPTVLELPTSSHCTHTHSHLAEPRLCNPDPVYRSHPTYWLSHFLSNCNEPKASATHSWPLALSEQYWNTELDLQWRKVDDGIPEWKAGASRQDASQLASEVFHEQKSSSTRLSVHPSL